MKVLIVPFCCLSESKERDPCVRAGNGVLHAYNTRSAQWSGSQEEIDDPTLMFQLHGE